MRPASYLASGRSGNCLLRKSDCTTICIHPEPGHVPMTSRQLISIPVVAVLAAGCASMGGSSRSSLRPQDGPRAHLSTNYDGSYYSRRVRTSFRVEDDSYVLVGHLGGDGRI